jgi:hypothetical protein
MKKVTVNSWYTYRPVGLDTWDGPASLSPGDLVKVKNLPGCPPANTMGHCHVVDRNGRFAGLVLTASLERAPA